MEISAVCYVDGSCYSAFKVSPRKMPKANAEAKARRHKVYSVHIYEVLKQIYQDTGGRNHGHYELLCTNDPVVE